MPCKSSVVVNGSDVYEGVCCTPASCSVSSGPTQLVVGLLGCGTVGGGVVSLLKKHYPFVRLKKVAVNDVSKHRPGVTLPENCVYVPSVDDVLEDEEINCIVEAMGGTGVAKDSMMQALEVGKHVVTANKAAISMYLDDFQALLRKKRNVAFMYEAAVCGGIPIVNVIRKALVSDVITEVVGIMNGTTNYMLTKMEKEGLSYNTALNDARQKGYAEADPSADVEGWDARSKLCILSKLSFGLTIDEQKIYCEGIQRITAEDFEYAKMVGHTIKLLGISEKGKRESDGAAVVHLSVSPVMVPIDSPLAKYEGVTNAVLLRSENLETSCYSGPGAGRFATANSIVADIIGIAERIQKDGVPIFPPSFPYVSAVVAMEPDFHAAFFIRFIVFDQCGVIHKISGLCEKYRISIFSILQTPIVDPSRVPFVIMTENCRLSQVQAFCQEMEHKRKDDFSFLMDSPMFIRYGK